MLKQNKLYRILCFLKRIIFNNHVAHDLSKFTIFFMATSTMRSQDSQSNKNLSVRKIIGHNKRIIRNQAEYK